MQNTRSILRHMLTALRRKLYSLRMLVPGLRARHCMERMVGPLGFWDQLQQYQLNVLQQMGMQPHHTVLDIGCGPLQGGIAFIRQLQPQKYVGVDRKKEAIAMAHLQISRNGLSDKNPLLFVSYSFGAQELGSLHFDFIWVSQMLYYLDPAEMRLLFSVVSRHLNVGGLFLGDIIGPEHEEHRRHHFPWTLHTTEGLRALARPFGLDLTCVGTIAEYGYPPRLSLGSNLLLRAERRPPDPES